MKLMILLAALFSFSALADVTPAQMKEIRVASSEMMYKVGARAELEPVLTQVKVVDQLGDRVNVKFTFSQRQYGDKTCAYWFSLASLRPVSSALCGF